MIDIKSISGEVLLSVIVTEDAVVHEELMTSDYVLLSWSSDERIEIPLGAYIEYGEERYSLLEPYFPERVDEAEWRYRPEFHARIDAWDKHPVCVYTYEDDGATVKTREFDWSFLGSPADAVAMVLQAIHNETGEEWKAKLAESLPASIEIESQTSSIKSVLASIASQCETEWWADKSSNILHISKCEYGDSIRLSVGENIGTPSVTTNNEGYYTRFYPLGSTKNIVQEIATDTRGVVNKRLTLDPAKYPGGYKDIRGHFENDVYVSDLADGEVFSKTVIFDDIFPHSQLSISDVRARIKYSLDTDGNKIEVGGAYKQYSIWYFKIADFEFDESMIIDNLNLSMVFKTGQLAGKTFELAYHAVSKTENLADDVTGFTVDAGDFEILITEENNTVIPGMLYLIPEDGNEVVLTNITMPDEYISSAREDLEDAVDALIEDSTSDHNTYEFDSYPVSFYNDNIDVSLGQSVLFVNGDTELSTRVLMVEKHLDYSFEQKIRVGNNLIKGTTQELKENVTSLNQNVDVLAAFNEASKSIQDSYNRAQTQMIRLMNAIGKMWYINDEGLLCTDMNVAVFGNLGVGDVPSDDDTGTSGGGTVTAITVDGTAYAPEDGVIDLTGAFENVSVDLSGYYTKEEVNAKIDEVQAGDVDLTNYYTKDEVDTKIEEIDLSEYATTDDVNTSLADKVGTSRQVIAGDGLTGGGDLSQDVTLTLAVISESGTYTKVTIDEYGRVTAGESLSESDIPALSISKISTLQTKLNMLAEAISGNEEDITTLLGYFIDGIANEAAKVANALTIALNNSKTAYDGSAAKSVSFYAPTAGGTSGHYLKGNGTTSAPAWQAPGNVESGNDSLVTGGTVHEVTNALNERLAQLESWFALDEDNNAVYTTYNFYSTKQVSAGEIAEDGGGEVAVVGGSGEWYNIKTKRIAAADTPDSPIYTIIENYAQFSADLTDTDKYRICLMTFSRNKGRGRSWRLPMFSPRWNPDTGEIVHDSTPCGIDWAYTWWPVTGTETRWWSNNTNIGLKTCGLALCKARTTITRNNKRARFGVAIYKKMDGVGTWGWQRVSNVAEVRLYAAATAGTVHTQVIV